MDEFSEENVIIEDIDQPLYKYCMFCRFDLSNKIVSHKQKVIQKLKLIILNIFITIFAIRCAVCLMIIKNERIPLYYFDIIQYFGGVSKIIYICAFIACVLSLSIIYILNNSHNTNYEWLKIIEVLKGLDSFESIEFNDKNMNYRYVKKIKFVKRVISLLFYFVFFIHNNAFPHYFNYIL